MSVAEDVPAETVRCTHGFGSPAGAEAEDVVGEFMECPVAVPRRVSARKSAAQNRMHKRTTDATSLKNHTFIDRRGRLPLIEMIFAGSKAL